MNANAQAFLSHGILLQDGGTCDYPEAGDVRLGVDRGDGETGTLALPPADKVLFGIGYGTDGDEFRGLFKVPDPKPYCPPAPTPAPPPRPRPVAPPVPCAPFVPVERRQREPDGDPCTFYLATRTFTAECPEGFTGAAVTKTAQYRSPVSLAHAEQMALALAKQQANAALQCTPVSGFTPMPAGISLLWT